MISVYTNINVVYVTCIVIVLVENAEVHSSKSFNIYFYTLNKALLYT